MSFSIILLFEYSKSKIYSPLKSISKKFISISRIGFLSKYLNILQQLNSLKSALTLRNSLKQQIWLCSKIKLQILSFNFFKLGKFIRLRLSIDYISLLANASSSRLGNELGCMVWMRVKELNDKISL